MNMRIPPYVRLFVSEKKEADLLTNPLCWTIVSKRMYEIIGDVVNAGDFEAFPIGVYNKNTSKRVGEYILLNSLRKVSALARDPSERTNLIIDNLTIAGNSVPADAHLFRLAEQPLILLFDDIVLDALTNKGLNGVAAIKTQTVMHKVVPPKKKRSPRSSK